MKIINKNLKQGEIKVKVDGAQDLWYLSKIVEPNDSISGMTERKVKIGSGADDRSKITRRMMFLKIGVEKVDYDSTLRISGRILEGPDDVPKGDFHTFDITEGTIFTIHKERWSSYSLKKLDESLENQLANMLIVAFDREEAIFSILKSQGHEVLLRLKGDVSKKGIDEKKGNFYAEIYSQLQEYDKRYLFDNIVLASPAFWKEYLLKEIKDEILKKKIVLATCSSVDDGSIHEILNRPELKTILEKDKATREYRLVEELIGKISKELAVYGIGDVSTKILAGNAETLFVSENLISQIRKEPLKNNPHFTYEKLDELMTTAENLSGEVKIISSSDACKKLDGISGIALILKWKEYS